MLEMMNPVSCSVQSKIDEVKSDFAVEMENFEKAFQALNAEQEELQAVARNFMIATATEDKKPSAVVHLNVGGQHIDVATSAVCGSTLLGCLLREEWRSLLLRDKRGRIFLDFDADWMEPIFDAMCEPGARALVIPCETLNTPRVHERGYERTLEYFQLSSYRAPDAVQVMNPVLQADKQLAAEVLAAAGRLLPSESSGIAVFSAVTLKHTPKASDKKGLFTDFEVPISNTLTLIETADAALIGILTDCAYKLGDVVGSAATQVFIKEPGQEAQWFASNEALSAEDQGDAHFVTFVFAEPHHPLKLRASQSHCSTYPSGEGRTSFKPSSVRVYQISARSSCFPVASASLLTSELIEAPPSPSPSQETPSADLIQLVKPSLVQDFAALKAKVEADKQRLLAELFFLTQHVCHTLSLAKPSAALFYGRAEAERRRGKKRNRDHKADADVQEASVAVDEVNKLSLMERIRAVIGVLQKLSAQVQQENSRTSSGSHGLPQEGAGSDSADNVMMNSDAGFDLVQFNCGIDEPLSSADFPMLWSTLKKMNSNWRAILVDGNTVELFVCNPLLTADNYSSFRHKEDYFVGEEELLACHNMEVSGEDDKELKDYQSLRNIALFQEQPPLVQFNVRGKIFTVNRRHLLAVFPDSQLAVRLSGRWQQEVDKEGSMCLDHARVPFACLLNCIRMSALAGDDSAPSITVPAVHRNALNEMLDYLLIKAEVLVV